MTGNEIAARARDTIAVAVRGDEKLINMQPTVEVAVIGESYGSLGMGVPTKETNLVVVMSVKAPSREGVDDAAWVNSATAARDAMHIRAKHLTIVPEFLDKRSGWTARVISPGDTSVAIMQSMTILVPL